MLKRDQELDDHNGPMSSEPKRRKFDRENGQGQIGTEPKQNPAHKDDESLSHSPYSNDEYTVGWICALPIEMAAAKAMMDEEHGDPQTPPQQADQNTYILGRIRKFKDMLHTFPDIRVSLLVGIGAGIPDYESDDVRDIRLGDVVISSDKENGGVVLYDFGKKLPDGSFMNMYALDRPPRPLRTAIALLEAEHQTRKNRIPQYIGQMLEKYPYMRKKGFTNPGQWADQLFRPDYRHMSGRTCTKCDPAERINREPENRSDSDPVIHYGVIATGSVVVKHALTREEIRQKHRAICLEMEAAGLMNNFPCVVIRGISDYADSHKNDQWQPYAAASAAACAKELLEYAQPKALDQERTAKELLNQG
jgi:nucleoside phosphorylase